MSELLESVPNFSEGRDRETIDAIASAIRRPDVHLLDVQSDVDHNRSVFTIVGAPEWLVDAVFDGVAAAVTHIDLREHRGAHPRMGAADVVPFVPLLGTKMEVALLAAATLGERIATELGVPVHFYEESARHPDRRSLEKIRGKGFEELRETTKKDTSRAPDLGPNDPHKTAGSTAVGARRPLIAYNIYLNTSDLKVARTIAATIRQSSGGLRYVKAMGFEIPERGCVQVSMNLTYYQRTAIYTVFEMVREAAASYGLSITDSEIVGMAPAEALVDVAKHYLRMHDFRLDQALELRLLEHET